MERKPPQIVANVRLRRTIFSLGFVCAAYLTYAVLAVPIIEPSVSLVDPEVPRGEPARGGHDFERWFTPGSWERNRPKILQTNHGTLLFDDYTPLNEKSLQLRRCTLISTFRPDPGGAERPIILRASDGAYIYFDSPISISQGRFGRLTGGRLAGKVTIESPPTAPGGDDALRIETSNIQIDEQRIWTPEAVHFRYGANQGSGRNLSLYLHAPGRQRKAGQLGLGRIKSLELLEVERFELQLAGGLFTAPGQPATTQTASHFQARRETIEIRCRGPFRFDFDRYVGSLEEQVEVVQHRLSGQSDRLSCELLELHFQQAPPGASRSANAASRASSSEPQPHTLVAQGYPVIVRAPSRNVTAQAERIEYDLMQRKLLLKDRERLTLRQGSFLVAAPELEYQFDGTGQLGRLWAAGPGKLEGRFGPEAKQVAAEWNGEVRLDAFEQGKVLSVKLARQVAIESFGQLAADELYLYLSEQAGTGRPVIRLDGLQALGNVEVESARLSARLREARVWFRHLLPSETLPTTPQQEPGLMSQAANPADRSAAARHHLEADRLHAQVILGAEPQLERLDVAGNVVLRELLGGGAGVSIAGDVFQLENGHTSRAVARLIGHPARGSLRGLRFVGGQIEVRQGENVVEIPGPGSVTLPSSAKSPDRKGVPPVNVRWTGRMHFDGRTIHFVENVVATGSQTTGGGDRADFSGSGELLDVTLSRRVTLARPQTAQKIGVRELAFRGWVYLEHQLYDPQDRRKSSDQMRIRDLTVDDHTGRLHGLGPGWMVHRGRSATSAPLSLPGTGSRTGLQFLRVNFERQMTGNLHQREVHFQDQIRCLYGLIDDWDSQLTFEGRSSLGEQDVLLTSQFLQVVEMPHDSQQAGSIELQAVGNAQITGRTFAGSGHRLSYARGKDQLVLEGDGRSAALLSFQKTPNTAPAELAFAKVLYYPSTRLFALDGIRSFEVPRLDQFDSRADRMPAQPR